MAKIESKDDGLYASEDVLFFPPGIDIARYNQKFLSNSRRLFKDGADAVEIIRILSGNQGKGESMILIKEKSKLVDCQLSWNVSHGWFGGIASADRCKSYQNYSRQKVHAQNLDSACRSIKARWLKTQFSKLSMSICCLCSFHLYGNLSAWFVNSPHGADSLSLLTHSKW